MAIKSVAIYNEYEAISVMHKFDDTAENLYDKRIFRLYGMIDDFGWNLFHWAVTKNLIEFIHIAHKLGICYFYNSITSITIL